MYKKKTFGDIKVGDCLYTFSKYTINPAIQTEKVVDVTENRDGTVYLCTNYGLWIYPKKNKTFVYCPHMVYGTNVEDIKKYIIKLAKETIKNIEKNIEEKDKSINNDKENIEAFKTFINNLNN